MMRVTPAVLDRPLQHKRKQCPSWNLDELATRDSEYLLISSITVVSTYRQGTPSYVAMCLRTVHMWEGCGHQYDRVRQCRNRRCRRETAETIYEFRGCCNQHCCKEVFWNDLRQVINSPTRERADAILEKHFLCGRGLQVREPVESHQPSTSVGFPVRR